MMYMNRGTSRRHRSIALCSFAAAALAFGQARADTSTENDDPAIAARRLSPRNDSVYLSIFQIYQPSLSSRDIRVSVGAPLLRGDGYGVGLFPRYAATWIEGDQLADELVLHRFDIMLGGGGRVAPGWSLRGALGASYGSDLHLDGVASAAFGLTAAALVNHVLGPSDAIIFGVAYSSSSSLYPVLPILGYVHQSAGSRFRFDAQLPHHIRVSYDLTPRLQAALGLEVHGDKWLVRGMHTQLDTRRDGGSAFAELGVAATGSVRVDVRIGISVDRYTLPDVMTDTSHKGSLALSGFAQLLAAVAR
jgi:hypothetical protein